MFSIVRRRCLLGGILLLASTTRAASQEGVTITGWGPDRVFPTADAGRLVVLVRHAEKASEPRADPPLSDAGRARAGALADVLASSGIDAIVVTPFERTRATAAPLARARGITPVEIPVGPSVPEHVAAVAAAVRAFPPDDAVLVVGHSNTIPDIVTALGGPDLADLCDSQYSVLYVMMVPAEGPVRLVTASYGAPDPAVTGCPSMR